MEGLLRTDLTLDLPGDVEEARIHADRLVGAPIAQGPVQLLEALGDVAPVPLEGDGDLFLGVHVADRDRPRVAVGDGILRAAHAQQQSPGRNPEHQRPAEDPFRARLAFRKRGV